jgi:hypothetical protein
MYIQEALKETGKAILKDYSGWYCVIKEGNPRWNDVSEDRLIRVVMGKEVIRDDWQPYHEAKEIRPLNPGEFWEAPSGAKFLTYKEGHKLYFATKDTTHKCFNNEEKLGCFSEWTRLYPPVEDDSVERIEINDIQWFSKVHKYPEHIGDSDPNPNNFQDIPLETPMKMILEIPKEGI